MSRRDGPPDDADPLRKLSMLLSRLPGIGEKSALRLALSIVRADSEYKAVLAETIDTVRTTMRSCEVCRDLSHADTCTICSDARRDRSTICVIAHPQDRMAIERSGVFKGLYHVLHGVLDPLAGVGPAELQINTLLERLRGDTVTEVIVATSPNVEGDATALYISKIVSPLRIRVTRIASGLAVGGELEYADLSTLHRALEDRRPLS
jgi:recombination protein RecR